MANQKKWVNPARQHVSNRSGNRDARLMHHTRVKEQQGQRNRTKKRKAGSPINHTGVISPDIILFNHLTRLARQIDLNKFAHKLAEVNQVVEQVNVLLRQLHGGTGTHAPVTHPYPRPHPGTDRSQYYSYPRAPIQSGVTRPDYHGGWTTGRPTIR
ncbi:hypothetical protein J2S00_003115 [Caldalkalibacillus uzonensis]|uniref:Spore coat protein n=1 Tax=Caldalkalibacillus uzonensis TaxID=353224 RepID=A0ABU0CWM9_9BACI|nr:hypothetical protein [Caldalkalibacillus uzonensis]MDQ0340306.1 hypothetical protein [Caldalkalibacillus uzonensis]